MQKCNCLPKTHAHIQEETRSGHCDDLFTRALHTSVSTSSTASVSPGGRGRRRVDRSNLFGVVGESNVPPELKPSGAEAIFSAESTPDFQGERRRTRGWV